MRRTAGTGAVGRMGAAVLATQSRRRRLVPRARPLIGEGRARFLQRGPRYVAAVHPRRRLARSPNRISARGNAPTATSVRRCRSDVLRMGRCRTRSCRRLCCLPKQSGTVPIALPRLPCDRISHLPPRRPAIDSGRLASACGLFCILLPIASQNEQRPRLREWRLL